MKLLIKNNYRHGRKRHSCRILGPGCKAKTIETGNLHAFYGQYGADNLLTLPEQFQNATA